MPVRYAHHPPIAATRHRHAISRFRLPGSLRAKANRHVDGSTLLSHLNYITAAKAAEWLLDPMLKQRGYQAPDLFTCREDIAENRQIDRTRVDLERFFFKASLNFTSRTLLDTQSKHRYRSKPP